MKASTSNGSCFSEDLDKLHGRLEQRHIKVLNVNDPERFGFSGVRQVFRIEPNREVIKEAGSASTETTC